MKRLECIAFSAIMAWGHVALPQVNPTVNPTNTKPRVRLIIPAQSPNDPPIAPANVEQPPAETGTQGFQLPAPGLEFAIDSTTGSVGAVVPTEPVLRIYPRLTGPADAATAATVPVGGAPCGVGCVSLDGMVYFVVLCETDHSIHLIDAAKRTETARIALAAEHPVMMALASDAPYLWYLAESGDVGRVDLKAKRDEGLATTSAPGPYEREMQDIGTSADGMVIYNRRPGSIPTGIQAFRAEVSLNGKLKVASIARLHDSTDPYVPDPWGESVGGGNKLWDRELQNAKTVGANIIGFLPDRPVIITFDGNRQIRAYSYNTLKPLGAVVVTNWGDPSVRAADGVSRQARRQLPTDDRFVAVGNARREYRMLTLPDDKNGNVIVVQRDRAAAIPVTSLSLPNEPFLVAKLVGSTTGSVGQATTLEVRKRDPRATVTLSTSSPELKLTGDKLVWTPTNAGVCVAQLLISSAGGEQRAQSVKLIARRRAVELDFVPVGWALTADGKSAVAFTSGSDRPPMAEQKGESRLAVVDLQSLKVTMQRTLTVNVGAVAIDDQFVYVGLTDSTAMLVLNRQDGSDVKRIFTKIRINRLNIAGGKYLIAQGFVDGDAPPSARYRLPNLEAEEPVITGRAAMMYGRSASILRVGDAWYDSGVLWNNAFDQPLLLLQPPPFVMLPASDNNMAWQDFNSPQAPVSVWGVQLMGNQLRRGGQMVGQFQHAGGLVPTQLPCLLTLLEVTETRQMRDGPVRLDTPFTKSQVMVRDLTTCQPIQTVTLTDEPRNPDDSSHYSPFRGTPDPIQESTGTIVVQSGKRLFPLTLAELGKDKLKPTLHWELQQQTLVVAPDKPTTIAIKAAGGKGRIEYSLTSELPWLSMDRTGQLTITPEPAMKKVLDLLVQRLNLSGGMPQMPGDATKSPVSRYQEEVAAAYTRIIGRPPNGLPVLIMAGIAAKDSEQLVAAMQIGFLMDVPANLLTAKVKAITDEQKKQRDQMMAAQADIVSRSRRPSTGPTDTTVAELQQKVADLERRNIELQSQVKLLKEMLSEKSDGKTK